MSDLKVGSNVVYGMTIGSASPRPRNSWGGGMIPLIGEVTELEGDSFAHVRTRDTGQVHRFPVEQLKPVDDDKE